MKQAQMLTEQEFTLIRDGDILHIKTSAINKIKHLLVCFHEILYQNMEEINHLAFIETEFISSKISKGENYLGLPYLILDYPARFSNTSIFAFRTLFWWGNFFSFTLHLQSEALERVRENLVKNTSALIKSEFYICVSDSPWNYHYDTSNYKRAKDFEIAELKALLEIKSFIKISAQISLEEYQTLSISGLKIFNRLVQLISPN